MTFSKPDSSCVVGMKRRRKERKEKKKETVGTGWEEQGQICMNEWNRENKRERGKWVGWTSGGGRLETRERSKK